MPRALVVSVWLAVAMASPVFAEKIAPPDRRRIDEVERMLPLAPAGFGQKASDRAQWDALGKNPMFTRIISEAEGMLKAPFPAWDDALYLDFSKTGTRPPGEAMIRARHRWLAPLVWAECLENKGRFLPRIEEVLKEYLREQSWTLPAHDRDLVNYYGRSHTVDLGSSTFAMELAQALYLLDGKLGEPVRRDVMGALEIRIFSPIRKGLTGKGHPDYWLTVTNNWNAVCLAGVTGAALAVLPERKDRAFFAVAAERYSRNYLEGYNSDGYCTEGMGYYDYGFGNYIVLREELWQATKGRLDLFANPKLKKIALFGPSLEIINGVYPAFADCRFGSKPDTGILWYCSRVLGLGLHEYDNMSPGGTDTLSRGCLYTFPNSASLATAAVNGAKPPGLRSYFQNSGVLICRPAKGSACRVGAALKGGNNDEHHNHNDLGSFVLALGKENMLGDPGGPMFYNSKTFGKERYTAFKLYASVGHPVPLVAGVQQRPGRDAAAKILRADFTDDRDDYVMDLRSAYPVPGLKKLTRSFAFLRPGAGTLTITDEFGMEKPGMFESALTTYSAWKQTGPDTLVFEKGGERLTAGIQVTRGSVTIREEKIEEGGISFTRIGIRMNEPLAAGAMKITFSPAVPANGG